ncbi:MAG: ABC transporter substrate-binding protein [Halofilum sp. (in: g-proteobacteria)]
MHKRHIQAVCVAAAVGLCGSGSAVGAVPESDESIKIVTNNWTSQVVQSHIAATLLQDMGYSTEMVPTNTELQWPALEDGEVNLQMEVWEGINREQFNEGVEAGTILDVGQHDATTREEWWYPAHVEEQCPGLPDWQALNDCAEIFATPETYPSGRYLGGPVEWNKGDHALVEALDLDFKVINAGSASALWAELDAAVRAEEPIVMFFWKPNWAASAYEGSFVEFPANEEACNDDPEWGPNPDVTGDCGNPYPAWLKKAMSPNADEQWPCAVELVRNMNFSDAEVNEMSRLVDQEDLDYEEAAEKWIEDNAEQVESWQPECATSA